MDTNQPIMDPDQLQTLLDRGKFNGDVDQIDDLLEWLNSLDLSPSKTSSVVTSKTLKQFSMAIKDHDLSKMLAIACIFAIKVQYQPAFAVNFFSLFQEFFSLPDEYNIDSESGALSRQAQQLVTRCAECYDQPQFFKHKIKSLTQTEPNEDALALFFANLYQVPVDQVPVYQVPDTVQQFFQNSQQFQLVSERAVEYRFASMLQLMMKDLPPFAKFTFDCKVPRMTDAIFDRQPDLLMTVNGHVAMIAEMKYSDSLEEERKAFLQALSAYPFPPAYTSGVHVILTICNERANIWLYDSLKMRTSLLNQVKTTFPTRTSDHDSTIGYSYDFRQLVDYRRFLHELPAMIKLLAYESDSTQLEMPPHSFNKRTCKVGNVVYKCVIDNDKQISQYRASQIQNYQQTIGTSSINPCLNPEFLNAAPTNALALSVPLTNILEHNPDDNPDAEVVTTTSAQIIPTNVAKSPASSTSGVKEAQKPPQTKYFFVTAFPYVKGTDVYGKMSPTEASRVLQLILDLHKSNFYHNDIRLPNLVKYKGLIHLIDFEYCTNCDTQSFSVVRDLALWKKFSRNRESPKPSWFLAYNVWSLWQITSGVPEWSHYIESLIDNPGTAETIIEEIKKDLAKL